jgi:hypothetical protein
VVARLRRLAHNINPVGKSLNDLLVDARDRGAIENLMLFAYHGAALTARYDSVSHLGPTRPILPDCSGFASIATPDCSANFGPVTTAVRHHSRARTHRKADQRTGGRAPAGGGPSTQKSGDLLAPLRDLLPSLRDGRLPGLPQGGDDSSQALDDLLDFLLK